MSSAVIGLFAGLLLALVAAVGGLSMFLLALVLAGVGLLVGLLVDGRLPGLVTDRRDG